MGPRNRLEVGLKNRWEISLQINITKTPHCISSRLLRSNDY